MDPAHRKPMRCPSCRGAVGEADRFCRHCGRPLTDRRPRSPGRRSKKTATGLTVLAWLTVAITTLLIIAVDVEVIVGAGPLLVLLALAMLVTGVVLRSRRVMILAVAHIAVCVGVFLMIEIMRLGPHNAGTPCGIVGVVWTVLALPWTLWVFLLRLPARNPWECVKCGYLLVGLDSTRCPECGAPFTPPDSATSPPPNLKPDAGPALP